MFANIRDCSREFGKINSTFSWRLFISGEFSLVILSKLVFEVKYSVFALIRLALAPAKDDSDCAKSVKVISPFWTLALSESTCLSNKSTLDELNSSFFDLKINWF